MSNGRRFRMTEGSASNPLKSLERVKGIEPSSSAWKIELSTILIAPRERQGYAKPLIFGANKTMSSV
jgi:hypothetical protein